MGQYHYTVNLDKHEFIQPNKLGAGLKIVEQIGTAVPDALLILLTVSNGRGGGDFAEYPGIVGRWGGDRIAVVGDYTETDDLPNEPHANTIYNRCVSSEKEWTDRLHSWQEHAEAGRRGWTPERLATIATLPTYTDISDLLIPALEAESGWRWGRKADGSFSPGWRTVKSIYDSNDVPVAMLRDVLGRKAGSTALAREWLNSLDQFEQRMYGGLSFTE